MKLGKLLAAGKSIVNGHEEVSYRASKQIYLPKFGPVKTPSKPETETAKSAPNGSSAFMRLRTVQPFGIPPPDGPERCMGTSALEVRATLPITKEVAAKTQKLPAISGAASELKTNWAGKLNPISIFRATPNEEARALAQTELSLDSVKVVYNDLSDAEVEIVPIKSRSVAPETPPAKKSWEFLGERLFGVEAT